MVEWYVALIDEVIGPLSERRGLYVWNMGALLHDKYPESDVMFRPRVQSAFSCQQYTLSLCSPETQIFNDTYHLRGPGGNMKDIKRSR